MDREGCVVHVTLSMETSTATVAFPPVDLHNRTMYRSTGTVSWSRMVTWPLVVPKVAELPVANPRAPLGSVTLAEPTTLAPVPEREESKVGFRFKAPALAHIAAGRVKAVGSVMFNPLVPPRNFTVNALLLSGPASEKGGKFCSLM